MRKDWEDVKEDVMYTGIKEKFRQNHLLLKLLLNTGGNELIENSPYDYYWGIGKNGTGKNRLGILLMKLREDMKITITENQN